MNRQIKPRKISMPTMREALRRSLRRNTRKNGFPGGFHIRMLLQIDGAACKSTMFDFGLDTRDEQAALDRAALLVRAFMSAGIGVTNRFFHRERKALPPVKRTGSGGLVHPPACQ